MSHPIVVMYRVGGPDSSPEFRPALVVRSHAAELANVQVLLDADDERLPWCNSVPFTKEECLRGTAYRRDVRKGLLPGQWRRVTET